MSSKKLENEFNFYIIFQFCMFQFFNSFDLKSFPLKYFNNLIFKIKISNATGDYSTFLLDMHYVRMATIYLIGVYIYEWIYKGVQ